MIEQNSTHDLLMKLKRKYMNDILSITEEEIKQKAQSDKDTITLYHGTTTDRLNSILQNGILPRAKTGIDNWQGEKSSIETVTYMTNKWHYFYAFRTFQLYINATYGDDFENIKHLDTFPCYVECKVPKGLLVMDEDFLFTRFMVKKINSNIKKQKDIVFNPMECLGEYGTVGVVGGVSPSMIVSFTVLGEPKLWDYISNPESPYKKEWLNWQHGKGKGKIRLKQLWDKEAESNKNGTWWVQEVQKNVSISFGINPSTGKMAMIQLRNP